MNINYREKKNFPKRTLRKENYHEDLTDVDLRLEIIISSTLHPLSHRNQIGGKIGLPSLVYQTSDGLLPNTNNLAEETIA